MGIFDRIKAFLGGNDIDGVGRSQQPATSEWLDSERFARERDAMLAWNRAKPERYVEGQKEWRGDPTWEEVELYLRKALINKREFVILNLPYPNIPFIQAVRESNLDTGANMLLQVRVCDEQIKDEDVVLLEKVVDADECREAFRLYFESGEVRNLDDYTPVAWVNP